MDSRPFSLQLILTSLVLWVTSEAECTLLRLSLRLEANVLNLQFNKSLCSWTHCEKQQPTRLSRRPKMRPTFGSLVAASIWQENYVSLFTEYNCHFFGYKFRSHWLLFRDWSLLSKSKCAPLSVLSCQQSAPCCIPRLCYSSQYVLCLELAPQLYMRRG